MPLLLTPVPALSVVVGLGAAVVGKELGELEGLVVGVCEGVAVGVRDAVGRAVVAVGLGVGSLPCVPHDPMPMRAATAVAMARIRRARSLADLVMDAIEGCPVVVG